MGRVPRVWVLVGITWAIAPGCGGGGSGGPEPVDVPVGLTVHCERALDAGTLPTDGTWVDTQVDGDTCVLYRFETTLGVSYGVHVLIATGNVDVIVSQKEDFRDLTSASNAFGSDPEAATFEAAGGTYWLALIGRAPASDVSLRIVTLVAPPAGVDDCAATVDAGPLATDGTPRSDVLLPRTCALYTFEGTIDSVYELILRQTGGEPPDGLYVASDRDFREVIASSVFLEPVTTMYPITSATQTHYLLTVGTFSDESRYDLSIERGNAPIGLATQCFHAEDRGPAPKDWSSLTGTVTPRDCHLYTIDATAGNLYVTGVRGVGLALDPNLTIASDEAFRSPVTTVREEIEGFPGEAFVAAPSQVFRVGVTLTFGTTLDYELRGLETQPPPAGLDYWCNRQSEKGALAADAGSRAGAVMNDECAIYTLPVQAGQIYSLSAVPTAGSLGMFAASDAAHAQSLGSSVNATGAQGFSFVAPTTGEMHVAVAGRADGTSYTIEARTAASAPAALTARCAVAVSRGALTLGATATGFAPEDHCDLYTFPGTNGTSYTVTVVPVGSDDPDLTIAGSATFSPILAEENTPGEDAIVFTAGATQTFHVAIHGFQDAAYQIRVQVSPTPPAGLSGDCTSLLDGGALVVGASSTRASAVEGQCVVYSFPGAAGTPYTVTVLTSRGNPSLVVASDAAFGTVLARRANVGGETYAFTPGATQSYHLAVFPGSAMTTDFEISVTTP